jgi:hypothetical protein
MRRCVVLSVLAVALVPPQTAVSGGGPVVGADAAGEGVTMPDLAYRWVTPRAGGHTVIAVIEQESGRIDITRIVREPLIVPAVAYDQTGTGLSADGTTLVLARARGALRMRRGISPELDDLSVARDGKLILSANGEVVRTVDPRPGSAGLFGRFSALALRTR